MKRLQFYSTWRLFIWLGNYIFLISAYLQMKEQPAVIDLTMYNGEPMGLYRLEYLKDVVDLFVVIESSESFTGIPKKEIFLNRNDSILLELERQKKLIKVIVGQTELQNVTFSTKFSSKVPQKWKANMIRSRRAWAREKFLRSLGLSKIFEVMGNRKFVVMVTDCDELPRKDYVAKFAEMYDEIGSGMRLVMASLTFSFKWLLFNSLAKNDWFFPYVITDAGILERNGATLDEMRIEGQYMASMTHIWHSGWHCSYCMSIPEIARKIESFSHQEMNKPKYKQATWVSECVTKGKDIFHRKDVDVLPYRCDELGLPDCPQCNMQSDAYRILEIASVRENDPSCEPSRDPFRSIMYVEYRNKRTGDRYYRPSHPFSFMQDYRGEGSAGSKPYSNPYERNATTQVDPRDRRLDKLFAEQGQPTKRYDRLKKMKQKKKKSVPYMNKAEDGTEKTTPFANQSAKVVAKPSAMRKPRGTVVANGEGLKIVGGGANARKVGTPAGTTARQVKRRPSARKGGASRNAGGVRQYAKNVEK